MPTIEKRIQVTPSSQVAALLREFSLLTGKPASAVIRELLDHAAPTLAQMVEIYRAARLSPEQGRIAAQRFMDKSIGIVEEAKSELVQQSLDLDQAMKRKPGRKPGSGTNKGGEAVKT